MKDMAKLVATQTYQALTTSKSPLATKAEFACLDHWQSIQETQLATIIKLLKNKHNNHHGLVAHYGRNSAEFRIPADSVTEYGNFVRNQFRP